MQPPILSFSNIARALKYQLNAGVLSLSNFQGGVQCSENTDKVNDLIKASLQYAK